MIIIIIIMILIMIITMIIILKMKVILLFLAAHASAVCYVLIGMQSTYISSEVAHPQGATCCLCTMPRSSNSLLDYRYGKLRHVFLPPIHIFSFSQNAANICLRRMMVL